MTPCDCNHEIGDTCPWCAPPAKVAPPKVGDKWDDLSPEQRAMVPAGTELTEQVTMGRGDRYITRLGPAPTTEPDRSGWPEIAADIMALEEKIGADADPRDAEIADLRAQRPGAGTALLDALRELGRIRAALGLPDLHP